MKLRPLLWIVLSLLLLAGVWLLWQPKIHTTKNNPAATQKIAVRQNLLATPGLVVKQAGAGSLNLYSSANASATNVIAKTNQFAYRLSNTAKAIGELANDPRAILLGNALIDTRAGLNLSIPKHLQSAAEPGSYIVQSRTVLDAAFRAQLAAAGAQIISYIPNNAYLVRMSAGGAAQMAGQPATQAVIPYEPYYKISSPLIGAAVQQKSLADGTVLNLGLFADNSAATVKQIESLGGKIVGTDNSPFGPLVRVLPPQNWTALAILPGVQIVEAAHPRAAANDLARVTMGISTDTITNANYLGLSGSNVVVEVNDTGIDATHPDFDTGGNPTTPGGAPIRVIGDSAASLTDTNGHGTHVAGIIAGNGAQSKTVISTPRGSVTNADFRGKAPQANLYSVGFLNANGNAFGVSDRYLQETPARTNALISNNSWTYVGDTEYDLGAASYDAAVRDALPQVTGSQPVLFVFAAGNDGGGNDNGGGGASETILSPATAKNVITVGAVEQLRNITNIVTDLNGNSNTVWKLGTDSANQVAAYSSRGNVGIGNEGTFGRFKPDVVAPGSFVVSTRSGQWSKEAYYNPTNYYFNNFNDELVDTNSWRYYGLSVPQNAVGVSIKIVPNNFSPSPFPTNLAIYVQQSAPPTASTFDFVTMNNQVVIPPDGGAGYLTGLLGDGFNYAVVNTNTFPVSYDLITEITTTNDLGNYYTVLSNLNETLGPYYRYESGTSMSAPAVSGMLALLQDFFTNQLHTVPSPALLKGMVINGARAVGTYKFAVTNGVNFQGWGLVNLTNSLPTASTNLNFATNSPLFFADQNPTNALATGDSQTFYVTVATNAQTLPLRVTLAWTDPPGNPAAAIKLVNNLDLVVTNLANGAVYFGNNFLTAGNPPFSAPWNTNTVQPLDSVNNIENVFLPATLAANYSVTVIGRSVNVNAVTAHTNNVVQDYALVISSGNGQVTNALTVTLANLVSNPTTDQRITVVGINTNGVATNTLGGIFFNQLAGENTPLLGTNAIPLTSNTNGQITLGMTNQWHFYVVPNNTTFTNAAFITFLPATLATPRMGVFEDSTDNSTRPGADIDMYVSTNSALTNLDMLAVSNADKSISRDGTEFVAYTNSTPGLVYYVAIKSEDHMAGEYGFFPIFSEQPFSEMDKNGNELVHGVALPVNIPDGSPAHPGIGYVFALAVQPIKIESVVVSNEFTHQNFGDLIGVFNHGGKSVVLNNHASLGNPPGPYDFIYDDSPSPIIGSQPPDGPGTLSAFQGQEGIGPWILAEVDDSLTQTGSVTRLDLFIKRHQPLDKGTTVSIGAGEWFYGFIDVPVGYTNLLVAATNVSVEQTPSIPVATPPLELFLKPGSAPTLADSNSMVLLTNCLVGTFPSGLDPGNTISTGPPLPPGRYFVGIFNPSASVQSVYVIATLSFSAAAASTPDFNSTGVVPLLDDAVSYGNSIFVTSTNLIQSLNVGLRVDHPRISDLVFHLISPDGTRYLLMENRGGTTTNGAGVTIVTTNIVNAVASGNAKANTNYINVGTASGTFPIFYDFFSVPDEMTVYYGTNLTPANLILDTGFVSGSNTLVVAYPPAGVSPTSTYLTIVMNQFGNTNGTAWTYTAGGVQTNYAYLTFTEDTNLASIPIKFATPPFVPLLVTNQVYVTNITFLTNSSTFTLSDFESASAGDYLAASTVDGWNVISNQVSVVNDPTNAQTGSKFLTLASGSVSRTLTTATGVTNTLNFIARGPGASGWWQGASNANDSVYGNNGTLVGASYANGLVGTAFQLPGSGYVQVPDNSLWEFGASDFTVEFWVNFTSLPTGSVGFPTGGLFIGHDDSSGSFNKWIFMMGGGVLDFHINGPTVNGGAGYFLAQTPFSPAINTWYHLAVERKNNVYTIYTNGVAGVSEFNSTVIPNASVPLTIGQAEGFYLNGKMDEVSIYGRALSPSEIKAIYQRSSVGKFDPANPAPQNLAEAAISVSGSTVIYSGANTNWQTNTITFVATNSTTLLKIDGLQPGMLLDSFTINVPTAVTNIATNVVVGVSNLYYFPEESLESLNNRNPYGLWQLEILDNRVGATNNASLVSWQLAFTFANTNFSIPTTTFPNTGPVTNTLPGGATAWYLIQTPTNADWATNMLLFATLPLNMWWSTNVPPTTTNVTDVLLLGNSTGGQAVIGTNPPPAFFRPGSSYYLGIQNSNSTVATYAIDVRFHLLPLAPGIITLPASSITDSNATLNARVMPNGLPTGVYFEYGLTTNYGLFSATVALNNNLNIFNFIGIGVSNLLPGAIYHFQAIGTNSAGTNFGGDLTFTNLVDPPTVITTAATNITTTTATLDALVTPNGAATTVYFEYGLTTNYGFFTTNILLANNLNTQQPVAIGVTNLAPNTLYHFQAIGTNIAGTNFGGDLTFTTLTIGSAPFAFTEPGTLLTGSGAQLNGFATANGAPSTAWFEWGTSSSYGIQTTPVSIGTNYSVFFVTNRISGLTTNLPYHYRLVVSNLNNVVYGFDQIFDQANVVAWGANYIGQTTVPTGMTNLVVGIGAGYEHSLAVKYNGTVVAWGINTFGQTNVPPVVTNAVGIFGGDRHSMALLSNRKVLVWGSNQFGQTNAPLNLTNAVEAASGGTHCLAVRTNGLLVAWGGNSYGQTNVAASVTNIVAVSGGELHSLALKNNGTVVAWGYNGDGETNVPVGLSNVVAIAAGGYHNLALKKNGTVVAWGDDNDTQCDVPAGLTNVIAIAAGGFHSLALKSDGTIVGWGDNGSDQLTLPLGLSNVVAIAGGGLHSLALSSIYGLNQTNNAPFWTNGLDSTTISMNELTTLTVTNGASDTNFPAQTLTYSLLNSPAWASINAQGVITLAPLEVDGPSTNVITTVVKDNGYPALSATNAFTIIVNEVNLAPFWPTNVPSQTNYNVNELTSLTVTNTARDTDVPTNVLVYALSVSGGVTNAAISTNGIITWTPTEAQGPGVYTFTTIVTDTNPYALFNQSLKATNTFTVTVVESNSPPQFIFPNPPNFTNGTGVAFVFTNAATDPDLPPNVLTYTLPTAPAGATVSSNGVITWTPTGSQLGTNIFITVVTDNGVPPLSATNQFIVIVTNSPSVVASNTVSIVFTNGGFLLTWFAPSNDLFQVQWTDSLAPAVWSPFTNIISYNAAAFTSPTNTQFNFFDDGSQAPFTGMRFYRLILLSTTNAPAAAPSSLVSHWPLNENTGTFTADVGSAHNNGVLTNVGTGTFGWTNGVEGSAVALTGTSITNGGFVTVGNPASLNFENTNKFSISAWMKTTNFQDCAIVGKMVQSGFYTGYEMHYYNNASTNQIVIWLINDYGAGLKFIDVRSGIPVNDGNWHQVAFTYDGSALAAGVKIYIDGAVDPASTVAFDTLGTNTIQNTVSFNIGSRDDGLNHNFTGAIDDVQVYNSVLSSNSMFALFKNPGTALGPSVSPTNFVATPGTNSSFVLQWNAPVYEAFQVQWTTNLVPAIVWNTFPGIITSTNGAFFFADTNAALVTKFYRLLLLP